MRPLTGELLLEAWERGSVETASNRPLALLAVARAGAGRDDLAGISLADRDVELLRLRRITFGDALRGAVPCGSCAARLEFQISVASIIDRLEGLRPAGEARWSVGGVRFTTRPATTRDLVEIASARDPRRRLLELCTSVENGDPASALGACEDRAVEQFNRLNEGAETRFTLPCPACGAADQVDLDIGRFFWTEVRHRALNLLREVHELARSCGWTERAILEMPAVRRACYLEMARA